MADVNRRTGFFRPGDDLQQARGVARDPPANMDENRRLPGRGHFENHAHFVVGNDFTHVVEQEPNPEAPLIESPIQPSPQHGQLLGAKGLGECRTVQGRRRLTAKDPGVDVVDSRWSLVACDDLTPQPGMSY